MLLNSPIDVTKDPEFPDSETYAALSARERRQVRNKISARNFRLRKKEYMSMLEEQVRAQQEEIREWRRRVEEVEVEKEGLKKEVEVYRKAFEQLSLEGGGGGEGKGIMRITPTKEQIHKDVSNSRSSSPKREPSWMQTRMEVHHALVEVMPTWTSMEEERNVKRMKEGEEKLKSMAWWAVWMLVKEWKTVVENVEQSMVKKEREEEKRNNLEKDMQEERGKEKVRRWIEGLARMKLN